MASERTRLTRHRVTAALVAGAAIFAACTSSPGATEPTDDAATTGVPSDVDDSVAPEGAPGESDDQSAGDDVDPAAPAPTTNVDEPDASGLPSLGDIDPEIVRGTLENGLRYFIRRNDNPGARVEMRLAIDAGSGLQTAEQGGGAHFLEHMLFNGTERFPENELIAVLRSFGAGFGADVNAYTNYDETVYELTMPTADPAVVTTGLDVLQQWLTAATIDPAQVEAERGVVLDEWRGSAQSVNGRIFDQVQSLFLDGSPYEGRRTIGTDVEISATTDGPLRAFYDDWYRPDNAAVAVVGDIDPGTIEQQLVERFTTAVARSGSPARPDFVVDSSPDAQALVFDDPDVSEGFAFVTLPLARDVSGPREAVVQRDILQGLAFEIIGTRLGNDALRGDAPFDEASVDGSGFVRLLEAPEIFVSADGADLEASTQVVLDEYERVRRYGFTRAEVDRAVAARRSSAQVTYDGRDSRQDASYADEYVRHFLEDESLPTGQRWFEYVTAVLDRATPETIAYMFTQRFDAAGAHLFVAVPSAEAAEVPPAAAFIAQAESIGTRPLEPRPDESSVGDQLMERPEPAPVADRQQLADGSAISFVAPTVLTFDNGVRVALNPTPITDGVVVLEARSPGGTTVLDDADVAAADVAAAVVEGSGVGTFDPVAIDAFLSDKEVALDATIDVFTEGFQGNAATSDVETLFQLIHLSMTQPRVDPVTLAQYLDDQLPLAEDPSINPNYARFKVLTDARYEDRRYQLLDVADLNGIEAADVQRVFADRFGDASDWVFSFNGDLDLGVMEDLAQRYLGTLPAVGRNETVDYAEPPPPPGAIVETTLAGEGDQASVTFLFTGPGTPDRRDDVSARLLQEVITARLTDVIREELGESYSPFAAIELTSGASPLAETFVTISTGPDLVDNVSTAVLAQIADIRANGVADTEFSSAVATIRNELELFSNEQINDEILDALTDPAGNVSFAEFENESRLVDSIGRDELTSDVRRWLPEGQYVEVRVLPR